MREIPTELVVPTSWLWPGCSHLGCEQANARALFISTSLCNSFKYINSFFLNLIFLKKKNSTFSFAKAELVAVSPFFGSGEGVL